MLEKQYLTPAEETVTVEYHGEIQKRKDSPVMTKVYTIKINENDIQSKYQDRDMVGIYVNGNIAKMIEAQPWKKYILEVME